MVRELQPWFENIGKRQIKTPKIYFKDSGIYHYLLGIRSKEELLTHPKLGASWEGFALEEILRFYEADSDAYGKRNERPRQKFVNGDGKAP